MTLSNGKLSGCHRCLEGSFLGRVGVLYVTIVQYAPLVSLRDNLILSLSHARYDLIASSVSFGFMPFL